MYIKNCSRKNKFKYEKTSSSAFNFLKKQINCSRALNYCPINQLLIYVMNFLLFISHLFWVEIAENTFVHTHFSFQSNRFPLLLSKYLPVYQLTVLIYLYNAALTVWLLIFVCCRYINLQNNYSEMHCGILGSCNWV